MKSMSRLFLALMLVLPLASHSAQAGEELVIRLAFEVPAVPENQYNELSIQFKEQVETISGGAIKVEVFGDGQLGTERENFEAVQMGTLEMSTISNASIGVFSAPAIAIDLPMMFPSKVD